MSDLYYYLNSGRILFSKVQELPDYRGTKLDEKIAKKNLEKEVNGNPLYLGCHEIENFKPRSNGVTYGRTQVDGTIHIESIDSSYNKKEKIENVLIIFISYETSKIIGYYRDATVFRSYQTNKFNKNIKYNFSTKSENAVLLARDKVFSSNFQIGHHYGYLQKEHVNILKQTLFRLEETEEKISQEEIQTNRSTAKEKKELKWHLRAEGRISATKIKEFKKKLGYECPICKFNFEKHYGEVGKEFIELHHLEPFHKLKEGKERDLTVKDFEVLCSNCHRMVHRKGVKDIESLKKRYQK